MADEVKAPSRLAWCGECESALEGAAIGNHDGNGMDPAITMHSACPGSGREVVYVPAGPVVAWRCTITGSFHISRENHAKAHRGCPSRLQRLAVVAGEEPHDPDPSP